MRTPMTVLITDNVDPLCMEMLEQAGITPNVQLKRSPEELKALAAEADGWIIRSGTTITADLIEAADRLKVIGRAGVGVDNVDLEAATRRGILVINAPDGNTISTAEHTCAMMMALARQIPQANASLRAGRWERKQFSGTELYEKTLGIVGVGKIGRAVGQRMQAFGMHVIGFDPVLAPDAAERLGIELVSLDELFERSDVITLHTPLNDATRGLLNRETLARCKPGVRIVNCARGGIVDEEALLEALESGHVGGAALDVYSQEPPPEALQRLIQHPKVVATPHIAASTAEAQQKVAVQITEQVILALKGEPVSTPVNAMAIRMAAQREVQPYLRLADALGRIGSQLIEGSLHRVTVRCAGDVPRRYTEVLSVAVLKGVLSRWASDPVNLINAPFLAREMGLAVEEQRGSTTDSYTNLIEVELGTSQGTRCVAGTIFGAGEPRLVQVDTYRLEIPPEGHLLFYQNIDRPGMLATVGRILAENNLNIAALSLGRTGRGSMALTVVGVDEPIPEAVRKRIAALDGVSSVYAVEV
ncbi:MAG: phosphoglycerate dehydrogenase [Bacteroidetes bacterium]|nr:MAG: phosphoglycerate dehydrogenase [Bacteroidota bacterium]